MAKELPISLLEFWCAAHGYALRSFHAGIAVIDHGFGDTVWTSDDLSSAVERSMRTATDVAALGRMSPLTYALNHNPNCASPFEIRAPGRAGVIDQRRSGRTLNDLGYGGSIAEAVAEMETHRSPVRGRRNDTRGRAQVWQS